MTPTTEEIDICRRLPPHEPQNFDFYSVHDHFMMVVTRVDEKGISLADGKGAGMGGPKPKELLDDAVWIPTVEQIMELDVWPDDYYLASSRSYEKLNGFQIWKIDLDVQYDSEITTESILDAPTARLACLRAIKPLLKEK